jgi:hypothetical protein
MGNRESLGSTDGFECDLSDSRPMSIAQRQPTENFGDQWGFNLGNPGKRVCSERKCRRWVWGRDADRLLLEKEAAAGMRRTREQGTRINRENDEGSYDIVGQRRSQLKFEVISSQCHV